MHGVFTTSRKILASLPTQRNEGNPKKTALELCAKIAYARDHRLHGVYLTKLFGMSHELAKWVDDNGPQHWSNALFPYRRWDKLYTNIAESFNNWILKLKELDIIQFTSQSLPTCYFGGRWRRQNGIPCWLVVTSTK